MKNVVIVTGATSGVGREFVRQLDGLMYGQVDEIWAVARDEGELERLAGETYAPVRRFARDLTDPASARLLGEALAEEQAADGVCVSWLVNSAGTGWFGPFQEMGAETADRMVRLNCLALVDATYEVLPFMQPGSHIVNMASAAAYMPLPGMGLYAATKRFVLDLTRSLNEDLRGTGITACAACPKAMRTPFWDGAGAEADKGMAFFFGTERVFDVVRKTIRAARAGRGSVITSPDMVAACALFKALPYGAVCAASRLGLAAARLAEGPAASAAGERA